MFHDGTKHQDSLTDRRDLMTVSQRRAACSISAIESPPNLSSAAFASTKQTMASPTTAAAGTAHTSLRSIVAGSSFIVAVLTDRNGFINVEMGFIQADTRTSSPLVMPPSRPPARFVGLESVGRVPLGAPDARRISSWT